MIYEVGYIILPTVGEDTLAPEISKLKEVLAGVDAKVIADEYPALITLQYEMVKRIDTKNSRFNQGYFGWIKFEAEADVIEKIKKQFDLNKVILRYMIISTVRENTLSGKKSVTTILSAKSGNHSGFVKETEELVEEGTAINEEIVDQEIDRLVEDTDTVEVSKD